MIRTSFLSVVIFFLALHSTSLSQEKEVIVKGRTPWVHGDFAVNITDWWTDKPSLKDLTFNRNVVLSEKKTYVTIKIQNNSENKIAFYNAASQNVDPKKNASFSDNFKNPYAITKFAFKVEGVQVGRTRVEPKKAIFDTFYFESIIDNAEAFFLRVPGSAFGSENETPVFRIQLMDAKK